MKYANKWIAALLVSVLVAMAAGCAGPPYGGKADEPIATPSTESGTVVNPPPRSRQPASATGRYFKSRWLDLMDTFEVGLSFGKWARVEAQYLVGTWGMGLNENCRRWRLGRRAMVADEDAMTIAPVPLIQILLYPFMWWGNLGRPSAEEWRPVPNTLWGVANEVETAIWPDPEWTNGPDKLERAIISFYSFDPPSEAIEVGLEAHLLIGARARVMPIQALDFVAGLFGFDFLEDDIIGETPAKE